MADKLDQVLASMKRLSGSAVVGALDGANATKLAFAEFGTERAPRRATMTPTVDAATGAVFRQVERRVGVCLDGRSSATGREVLGEVGAQLAELVQEAIDGNTPPPLAASTVAKRRREGKDTRTLVDTGEMLRSIRVETSDDPRGFRK